MSTSNNYFGSTEISWLENHFCSLAINATRYTIKNSNDPCLGNITEEKLCEIEEFVRYAKIIVGKLGHKAFEPLLELINNASDKDESVSYCRRIKDKIKAQGKLTSDGFFLLAGSKINYAIA